MTYIRVSVDAVNGGEVSLSDGLGSVHKSVPGLGRAIHKSSYDVTRQYAFM